MDKEITDAVNLLNELHRERLSYDEYSLLFNAIDKLAAENGKLRKKLRDAKEVLERWD